MLSENIRTLRLAKGLSQEELAVQLNVTRQTISKWERGLSVPDADLLIRLSEVFAVPVSTLLGETVAEMPADDLPAIREKLEVVNHQLAQREDARRNNWRYGLTTALVVLAGLFVLCLFLDQAYLGYDFTGSTESDIVYTILHGIVWVGFRAIPLLMAAAVVGLLVVNQKR